MSCHSHAKLVKTVELGSQSSYRPAGGRDASGCSDCSSMQRRAKITKAGATRGRSGPWTDTQINALAFCGMVLLDGDEG